MGTPNTQYGDRRSGGSGIQSRRFPPFLVMTFSILPGTRHVLEYVTISCGDEEKRKGRDGLEARPRPLSNNARGEKGYSAAAICFTFPSLVEEGDIIKLPCLVSSQRTGGGCCHCCCHCYCCSCYSQRMHHFTSGNAFARENCKGIFCCSCWLLRKKEEAEAAEVCFLGLL